MRFKHSVLPRIILILCIFSVILTVKYRKEITDYLTIAREKLLIHRDNFFQSSGTAILRKKPISLVQRETELALYIGPPFRDFSRRDWNDFWQIIYGVFPEPEKQDGMPARLRQLTEDEIAYKLTEIYPQPFLSFQKSHWQLFFDIALKKK